MKQTKSKARHLHLTHIFSMTSVILIMALFYAGNAIAAELASAIKDDTLRAEPFADAKTISTIKRGERLEIIKKQGAWLQVKSSKKTGWLRLLAVKRSAPTTTGSSANVLKQASGRTGTGQIVSTTGIRGLSEEELKAATFNESEIKQLESYTLNAAEGKKFAATGGLKVTAFANLTETNAKQATSNAKSGGSK
jgi:uncharacterized protein YraI